MMHHRSVHFVAAEAGTSVCTDNNTKRDCDEKCSNKGNTKKHNYFLKRRSPKAMLHSLLFQVMNRYRRTTGAWMLVVVTTGLVLMLCGVWLGTKVTMWLENNTDDNTNKFFLPFNDKYVVPGSHQDVGDRSDRYVLFRKEYDESVEDDAARSLEFAKNLQSLTFDSFPFEAHHSDQLANYDIYDCPKTPPQGYPFAWNVMDVLENWPVDDLLPRPTIYQGLCVFDYETDYDTAMTYRNLELPFVVKNDPNIAKVVERWNTPDYMKNMIGHALHRTEYSDNNHFMYYVPLPRRAREGKPSKVKRRLKIPEDWKASTKPTRMPFEAWLRNANTTEPIGPNDPHWYFRLIGCGYMGNRGQCDNGSSEYLFDELPFFQPRNDSLYLAEHMEQKGIHCRFGMDGVIAENHFDGSRNSITILGGSRRYILSHPDQCPNLALYPKDHPNGRHSEVNWSDPDIQKFPQFATAQVNEVVLQPGDAMYLPTFWFHHIVSLELNFQCNTRSGIGFEYATAIQDCGFNTR